MKIAIIHIKIYQQEGKMAKRGEKNPKRLGYGMAKVEFISNYDQIKKMIEEGFTMIDVYRYLIMKKKITMSPASFKNMCRPEKVKARNAKRRKTNEKYYRSIASN